MGGLYLRSSCFRWHQCASFLRVRILRDSPHRRAGYCHRNLTLGGRQTPVWDVAARTPNHGRTVRSFARLPLTKPPRPEWLLDKCCSADRHPPRVVSDGKFAVARFGVAGADRTMLRSNLKERRVLVDKDPREKLALCIEKFGCEGRCSVLTVSILKLLWRSALLVLVDRPQPFGNTDLLPRNVARPPARLARATRFQSRRAT